MSTAATVLNRLHIVSKYTIRTAHQSAVKLMHPQLRTVASVRHTAKVEHIGMDKITFAISDQERLPLGAQLHSSAVYCSKLKVFMPVPG